MITQSTQTNASAAMTAHTPGPWKFNGLGRVTADGDSKIIAQVAKELDGAKVGLSRSEKDANACLIASAPDLLAALVVVEGLIYEVQSDIPEEYRAKRDCMNALGIIRAAIDRAKGAR